MNNSFYLKEDFVMKVFIYSCVILMGLFIISCATTTYVSYSYKERMVETLLKEKWDCKEAVKSMASNLNHSNWYVRKDAAEMLGEIHLKGCPAFSAIPDLTAAMSDKDENVRLSAAWSLGIICENGQFEGIQHVIQTLSSGLKDKFWLVKVTSADSLGRIGREANSAIKALVDAGSDDNWWVRMFALLARKKIEESVIKGQ
jgi:HEAT repeat protein